MRVPVWTEDVEVTTEPDARERYVDPVTLSDEGRDELARWWGKSREYVDELIEHARMLSEG